MTISYISVGSASNDGTGTTLRAGGQKINNNFSEIYSTLGNGTTIGTNPTLTGLITITGRATVSKNITVSGNTTSNKLIVTSRIYGSSANAHFNKIIANSSLTVSGNTTLGDASADRITTTGLFGHTGRITVSQNLLVSGNTSLTGLVATTSAAPTVSSATTIAPVTPILFVNGIVAIVTITAPAPISTGGGTIKIIPTEVFTWTTAGNIALAGTAVVSKALFMTYDVTTAKWYPSYTS